MPQTKEYVCRFAHQPKQAIIKTGNCLIPFSIFSGYHNGGALKAELSLIDRTQFSNKFYLLGDSIYAHNFAMKEHVQVNEELRKQAHEQGDKWIKTNGLGNIEFDRWNKLLAEPDCQELVERVNMLYYEKSSLQMTYQENVMKTVNKVFQRLKKMDSTLNEHDKIHIINYILEECAVFVHYITTKNIKYIIYPGECPAAFSSTINILLQGRKIEWLELKMKENKKANETKKSNEICHAYINDNNNVKLPRRSSVSDSLKKSASQPQLSTLYHNKKRANSLDTVTGDTIKKQLTKRNESKEINYNRYNLFNNIELEIRIVDHEALKKLHEQLLKNKDQNKNLRIINSHLRELQKAQTTLINYIALGGAVHENNVTQASLVNGFSNTPSSKESKGMRRS